MVRLLLIALPLAALLGGCKTQSDLYCSANPGVCTSDGPPGGSDGSNDTSCHATPDCASHADKSVCDTSNGMCVACTTSDTHACPGEVCKNDACQPCTKHADCASNACLADGTCAKAADVAYVRSGGTGTTCTDNTTSACATINLALATNKPVIKVEGAITDNMSTVIDGKAVQILADSGSKLTRTGMGPILDVRNDADVRLYDLEITGGTGDKLTNVVSLSNVPASTANPKLTLVKVNIHDNSGIGIAATAGTLTLSRCSINTNAGGGLSIVNADFDITNNFIQGNGAASGAMATTFGGVLVTNASSGTRRFEFNTVANNTADANLVTGVNCTINQSFSNNIIFDNATNGGRTETSGCSWTYSDIEGTTIPPGTGNLNSSPSFVAPGSDYHLKSDSPAKNAADPAAILNIDFDGDPRPLDGRSDMGADEFTLPH